jgi:hypothetical protein
VRLELLYELFFLLCGLLELRKELLEREREREKPDFFAFVIVFGWWWSWSSSKIPQIWASYHHGRRKDAEE